MKIIPVQMQLREDTFSKVDDLCFFFQTLNKAEAIAMAIRLTALLVDEFEKGGKIECKRYDGTIVTYKI